MKCTLVQTRSGQKGQGTFLPPSLCTRGVTSVGGSKSANDKSDGLWQREVTNQRGWQVTWGMWSERESQMRGWQVSPRFALSHTQQHIDSLLRSSWKFLNQGWPSGHQEMILFSDMTQALEYSQFLLVEMDCTTSTPICKWMVVNLPDSASMWMEWFCAQLRETMTTMVLMTILKLHAVESLHSLKVKPNSHKQKVWMTNCKKIVTKQMCIVGSCLFYVHSMTYYT